MLKISNLLGWDFYLKRKKHFKAWTQTWMLCSNPGRCIPVGEEEVFKTKFDCFPTISKLPKSQINIGCYSLIFKSTLN